MFSDVSVARVWFPRAKSGFDVIGETQGPGGVAGQGHCVLQPATGQWVAGCHRGIDAWVWYMGGDAYQSLGTLFWGRGGRAKFLRSCRVVVGSLKWAGLRAGRPGFGSNEMSPVISTSQVFSSVIGNNVNASRKLEKQRQEHRQAEKPAQHHRQLHGKAAGPR